MAALARVTLLLFWLAWAPSVPAQGLPPAEWSEPVVTSPIDPASQSSAEPLEAESASPQELAAPLDQAEIRRIHAGAEASVLPIRAIYRQPPMTFPETVSREGVATLVDYGGDGPVFVTASIIVQDAEQVTFEVNGQPVEARVVADARYGLAVLVPTRDVSIGVEPIELMPVDCDDVVEVFSIGANTMGATIGAGEGMYAFYQVTTLGVTSGYPLVNRQGDLVGIGSHLHPDQPGFSLSIPSDAVATFIDEVSR